MSAVAHAQIAKQLWTGVVQNSDALIAEIARQRQENADYIESHKFQDGVRFLHRDEWALLAKLIREMAEYDEDARRLRKKILLLE